MAVIVRISPARIVVAAPAATSFGAYATAVRGGL